MNNKPGDLDEVSKHLDKHESEILDAAKRLEHAFTSEHENSIRDKLKNKSPKVKTPLR
jgi:hypothetical protein